MFFFASLALSKNRVVFRQPDFVSRFLGSVIGESLHGSKDGFVVRATEIFDDNVRLHVNAQSSLAALPSGSQLSVGQSLEKRLLKKR